MEITPEILEKAKAFIDPKTKKASLNDLRTNFNLTFYEALDLRREMEKRRIVEPHKVEKREI